MRNEKIVGGAVVGMLALAGCPGPSESTPDAYSPIDALVIRSDAGANDAFVAPGTDAFVVPGTDAFVEPGTDAFMPMADDAFTPGTDAFVVPPDAFSPPGTDAFVAWPTDPCMQIAMIRSMSGGALGMPRPVTGAVVSYVLATQPSGASDPIGFFVQCPGSAGPALFVAIDPATVTPAPAVGDVVSFNVTEAQDVAGGAGSTGDQHRVTAITGYARTATGMTIAAQNVSSLDLPAMIDAHESELVTITGTIAAAASPAGTGYTSYQITTAGFPTAGPTLRVRMPASVAAALVPAPAVGCTVTAGPTPLWRFTTTAQPMAWRASEIMVSCPTPAPTAGQVFVTEVGYQFTGSDNEKEFVELHNPSATTYDLSGCILSDNGGPADARAVTFPAGTLIAAGDYFVIAGAMSDITGDLVLPDTLGFGGEDAVQLHCGGTLIDAVMWTASGIGGADEVSAQLDLADITATGAMDNDMASNWCSTPVGSMYGAGARRGTPGAANVACVAPPACTPPTHLVINEIDYDMEGTDNAEFVELYNPTASAIDLSGHTLVAINGGMAGAEYARVALTGSIPAGGYVLVTAMGSTVAGATLSLSAALQNGAPDGVLLLGPAGVVDAVIYEGAMTSYTLTGGSATTLMESASAGTDPAMGATGLSRRPNGCDRDMPAMDWAVAAISPGATNL